jgi:cytochrome c2
LASGRPGGRRLRLALASAGLAGLLAGCQAAAAPPESPPAASSDPRVETGRQLFAAKGCGACHRAPGVPEAGGTIGPHLRGIGDPSAHPKIGAVVDNNGENMKRWLLNPQQVKPGTAMPSLGLTEGEAESIAAFLETLK